MKKIVQIISAFCSNAIMKKIPLAMVTVLTLITVTFSGRLCGQTVYKNVFYVNYSSLDDIQCCLNVDSIKCIPDSSLSMTWFHAGIPGVHRGDTLIVSRNDIPIGTGINITSGSKMLRFWQVTPPNATLLPTYGICGLETKILNPNNTSGFGSYFWSTNATTPTITVGQGIYSVTVTNYCGQAMATTTVIESNPNDPDLGPDPTVCTGSMVVLDPGTGYSSCLWLPGNSTDTTLTPTVTGQYVVEVTNTVGGCIDRDTVTVTFKQPPAKSVCYTGFDTLTWGNNVYLPLNLGTDVDSLGIYREASLGVFPKIGSVIAETDKFTDTNNCNPQNQSYSYKIAAFYCGIAGPLSSPHTTITLLATYDAGTSTYGFTWSSYIGLVVADYYLYGIDSSGVSHLIGTVPGNQYFYNYTNPNLGYVKYYIAFIGPNCSAKTQVLVKSNWIQSVLTSIAENLNIDNMVSVYPIPVIENLQIYTDLQITRIEIIDLTGRLLYSTTSKTVDCTNLARGIYLAKIMTVKGLTIKKFIK